MTALADLEGREFPAPVPFEVGVEHVRDFARAVGSSDPVHTDVEAAQSAGYAHVAAPVTYAAVVAQRGEWALYADPDVEIDFHRVVHGEERIEVVRPIVAGDVLRSTLTVERVREVRGNAMITTRTDVADAAGEGVASVWSMIVVRAEEQA